MVESGQSLSIKCIFLDLSSKLGKETTLVSIKAMKLISMQPISLASLGMDGL